MNLFRKNNNLASESLIKLQEEFEGLNTSYLNVSEQLNSLTEASLTLTQENFRLDEQNKALKIQLESVQEEIVEVAKTSLDVEEKITLKAVELIAEIGHEAIEILDDEEEDHRSVSEKFRSLTGQEAVAFFNSNKTELFKNLRK